jgi:hypothetical protein
LWLASGTCDSGDSGEQDIPKLRLLPSICCCLLVCGRILCVECVVRFSVFPGFSFEKCPTTGNRRAHGVKMRIIFGQKEIYSIKKRISSDILGGAIGSAFGCYDCKVQATGRFLVRSQAEELLLLLFHRRDVSVVLLQPTGPYQDYRSHPLLLCCFRLNQSQRVGLQGSFGPGWIRLDFATSTSTFSDSVSSRYAERKSYVEFCREFVSHV